MNRVLLTIFISGFSVFAFSQNDPIIFRPGPGENNGSDQGNINAGKDVFINEFAPETNYGDAGVIFVAPTSNCNFTKAIGYVRFDVSTLPTEVDSVLVGFTHNEHTSYCYSHCDANFYFSYALDDWDEMTINYSNMPTQGGDFYGSINITFPNSLGTREYNITEAYNNWVSGTIDNHGFAIHSPSVGCNNASVSFNVKSSDDTTESVRPYLKIFEASSSGIYNKNKSFSGILFPNPAKDFCTIDLLAIKSQQAYIKLFDLNGREIYHQPYYLTFGSNQIEIKISHLPASLYHVHIISNQGEMMKFKLMKE